MTPSEAVGSIGMKHFRLKSSLVHAKNIKTICHKLDVWSIISFEILPPLTPIEIYINILKFPGLIWTLGEIKKSHKHD